jgi:hypothetical protein
VVEADVPPSAKIPRVLLPVDEPYKTPLESADATALASQAYVYLLVVAELCPKAKMPRVELPAADP